MEEIIAEDGIQVGCTADSWEETIRIAAQPLRARGSIEPSYVQRMIDAVNTLGPYIVMIPGLAMAHAAPGPDVLVSDLSLAKFDRPVDFGSDKGPVEIVMCLACKDREAHIARLSRIAEKLMDDSFLGRMLTCTTTTGLYELING